MSSYQGMYYHYGHHMWLYGLSAIQKGGLIIYTNFRCMYIIALGTWWCHQMDTFSELMALCVGNSPVTGEFPTQRPVMHNFDVFFDLRLNKRLSKQSWAWWFETPTCSLWCHCNVLTLIWYTQHFSGVNEVANILTVYPIKCPWFWRLYFVALPMFLRVALLALGQSHGQSHDCPSASEATLKTWVKTTTKLCPSVCPHPVSTL